MNTLLEYIGPIILVILIISYSFYRRFHPDTKDTKQPPRCPKNVSLLSFKPILQVENNILVKLEWSVMQSTVLKEQCLQCSMKPIEHIIAANTVVTVFPEKKTVLSPTLNNPT